MFQQDVRTLELARRHAVPRASYLDGIRFEARRLERPTGWMKTRFFASACVVLGCLTAFGWIVALLAAGTLLSASLARTLVVAGRRRTRIDEETVDLLARDAQSIIRNGLLQIQWGGQEAENRRNQEMSLLLDDRRPGRAAIRRRAATAMVEIRCLHAQTTKDVDAKHQQRATDEARRALQAIRDEALAAIVPVQDRATDLLSQRLTLIVAAPEPAPEPAKPGLPVRTGDATFDALVARIAERIERGDDPVDAGGSPIAPLVEKHLPALISAHANAVEEGADRSAAQALLARSLTAMTRSFEEALAQPLPAARSAMDDLETRTRFLEARAERSLQA